MIRVEGLSVRFGDCDLRDITFTVDKGSSHVLLGPSGAGKTLLLETVMGIKRPDRGRILLDGVDITRMPPERRGISYVPQDLALFPHLSVKDNILFGLQARKSAHDAGERLAEVAALLEVDGLLDRRDIRSLSGGEKQRVALARALIVRPRVLFLDEPFSSLDAYLVRRLHHQFRELQKTLGFTVFQVTHDHKEAFVLADRMALMLRGAIVQEGTPGEFRERPATLDVARFLLAQNILAGSVCSVDTASGRMKVAVDSVTLTCLARPGAREGLRVSLVIRPENIRIVRPGRPLGPKVRANLLKAKLTRFMPQPDSYMLFFSVEGLSSPLELSLSPCAFEDLHLEGLPPVTLALPPEALWAIA